MTHLRRSLVGCLALILTFVSLHALGKPAASQKKSAKELAKEAQVDEDNDHWEAAFEKLRDAAAQKPNDKRIAEALASARERLANLEANEALNDCRDQKLDVCEKEVKKALSYLPTWDRAKQAESELATDKAQVQARWDQAHKMIDAGQLEEANKELDSLTQFAYLYPNLAAEKEHLHSLRVSDALKRGDTAVRDRSFDAALEAFNGALKLDPRNAEASRGIDTANKGKKAMAFYEQAKEALSAKKYDAAFEFNQNAVHVFPEGLEFQQFDKQLRAEWLPILEDQTVLSPKPTDLTGNQTAWENLEWIRRLDSGYKGLKDARSTISGNLYALYMARATDLENQPNYSRIGLAYLYHLNAQRTSPDPLTYPLAGKLTEDQEYFRRKRSMKILVGVRNLAPVQQGFPEVVETRVRAKALDQGLRDLELSSFQKYDENPKSADVLFQSGRPDNKSPVAEFDVDITTFHTESTGNEKPEDKPSKYVSGQETVANPEWQKAFDHFSEVTNELARNKHKNKPTKLHKYTETDRVMAEKRLEAIQKTIVRDKVFDYHYQEYHLSNSAHITMHLELRDYLDKQPLASDNVDVLKHDEATETSGVHEGDQGGLINRQARLKPIDQLLQDDENDALKDLDEKVPAMLANFTERYYNEAERALSDGRADEALEDYICYWYTFYPRVEQTRAQHIREVLKQYTGLNLSGGPGLVATLP